MSDPFLAAWQIHRGDEVWFRGEWRQVRFPSHRYGKTGFTFIGAKDGDPVVWMASTHELKVRRKVPAA